MIKEIIDKWDKNKGNLERWFAVTKQEDLNYELIVKKIFELVINDEEFEHDNYDINKMIIINHGCYQGTQIFIIPKQTCIPDIEDYLYTHNYYGSCSGCDSLESIRSYDDGLPNVEQIEGYISIALHVVQRLKKFEESERILFGN